MLIRLFNNSHPASLFIFLPLVAIVLWIPAFISSEYINTRNSMPLMEIITKLFLQTTWALSLLGLMFNIGSAIILNYIIDKHDVLERKTNLPALIFIVLATSFQGFLSFHPLQPATFLLLLSLLRIFDAYQAPKALSNAFDAGFFLGLAMLFYFPYFWYMPFLWTCLLIVRPFVWREYALSVIGALLPLLFAVSYYFFTDRLSYFWFVKIVDSLSETKFSNPSESWSWWAVFIIGLFIIILSVPALFKRINNSIIRAKSSLQTFIVYSFFSIFVIWVTGFQQGYIFYLLTFPIAVFWSNYFISLKKMWLGELLFSIYLVLVVLNQYLS